MIDNFMNYFYPVSGGSIGAIVGMLTLDNVIDTALNAAIFAFVGGIIGLLVKIGADSIRKECIKYKNKNNGNSKL